MIKKIYFAVSTTPDKRNFHRFGFSLLESQGFAVKFLDLTTIFNPKYLQYTPEYSTPESSSLKVYSLNDLQDLIPDVKSTLIICMFQPREPTIPFFEILQIMELDYALCHLCSIPRPTLPFKPTHKKILSVIYNPAKVVTKIYKRIISIFLQQRLLSLKPPLFNIVGGKFEFEKVCRGEKPINVVQGHCLDYDRVLEYKLNCSNICDLPEHYLVYLDDHLFNHPDYLIIDAEFPKSEDAQNFYNQLNCFLDNIEKITSLPVVVAAHPRAKYNESHHPFGKRRLICGKTCELVAKCSYVLAHMSTSINFAVAFLKPILFLNCDFLKATRFHYYISLFAKELQAEIVDLEKPFTYNTYQKLALNKKAYCDYQQNYIKMPKTPERLLWDIVGDYIKDLK